MTEQDDRLWARRPRGRHADLYDAEYARQLERMARIRDEVSVSLADTAEAEQPPAEANGAAARRRNDAPAPSRREGVTARWDAAPANLATPARATGAALAAPPPAAQPPADAAPLRRDDAPAYLEPTARKAAAAPDNAARPSDDRPGFEAPAAPAPVHPAPPRHDSPAYLAPTAPTAVAAPDLAAPPRHDPPTDLPSAAPAPVNSAARRDPPAYPTAATVVPDLAARPRHDPPADLTAPAPLQTAPPHRDPRAFLAPVRPAPPRRDPPPHFAPAAPVDPAPLRRDLSARLALAAPAAQPAPQDAEPPRRRARWLIAGVAVLVTAAVAVALVAGHGPQAPAATVFHVPSQPTGLVASGGKVWVAGPMAGAVWVLDAATGKPAGTTLRLGGTPARIALEPRFAWIADTERSAVIRAPRSGRGALRTIRTGPDLADVTVAAGAVWTASSADGTVRALDGQGTPLVLHVGVRPIALAGHEQRVVVLDAVGALFRLDATTRRQIGPPVDLGGAPVDVALVDDVAWVADARAGTVRAVAVGTGRAGPPIDVGRTPVAIAADAGGVYVVCRGDRTLVHLDANGHVRSRLPLAYAPTALALDSRHVWIAAGSNEVIRVDR